MSETLPIIFTENFKYNFNLLPERDKKRIEYDLRHMNKHDILRQGQLRGPYNYLRKMNNGDFRIFLAYCAECYFKFKDIIKCLICDGEDLERIIAFFIYPRKKLYYSHKFKKVDITKIKF